MPKSLNKAQIIGHLGQDPELRYTGSGTAVGNLSVATNETYTNSDGETVQKTEWHTVVCWEKLAEVVNEHLSKGDRLYVEGPLETRTWEDRDGNERRTTQIKALDVIFLGDGSPSGRGNGQDFDRRPADAPSKESPGGDETFEPDDELPF